MADFQDHCPKCGSPNIKYNSDCVGFGNLEGIGDATMWELTCEDCGYHCVEKIDL